jgi:hypothetical protein
MYITSCIYSVGQKTQFSSAAVDALSTAIISNAYPYSTIYSARRAASLDLESLKYAVEALHQDHRASVTAVIGTQRAQYIQIDWIQ